MRAIGKIGWAFLNSCLAALTAAQALAADVTVFAAASLKEAMDEHARQFEVSTGNKVLVAYGASSALAKQIESGAPADLIVSADSDWMDYLDKRKLLRSNTKSELLRNTLVLIAPASSATTLKIAPRFGLAAALGSEKLAMANPDSVPAGKYGKAALENLGVWRAVEKQVARVETVRAALVLVSRGEAPLGIVYKTDALADEGVKVVDTFPVGTHPAIVYPIAIVASSKSPVANALLDYLRAEPAWPVWEKHGFAVAK